MTALGLLNFVVLQWFCVRIGRVTVPGTFLVEVTCDVPTGQLITPSDIMPGSGQPFRRWYLLHWVWPLTGWVGPYRWIWRRR